MASATTMQRPLLGLTNGTAYEIALRYATGKQVSNGRIMFTTTADEVFFLDEFDADQIYNLELKPQEPFRIIRRNKQITVERIKVEQPVSQAPAAPTTTEPVPQQESRLQKPQAQDNSLSGLMASSYIAAIDALTVARDYAEHKGIPFKMSPAEVRAAAHCIFIAASRGATWQR